MDGRPLLGATAALRSFSAFAACFPCTFGVILEIPTVFHVAATFGLVLVVIAFVSHNFISFIAWVGIALPTAGPQKPFRKFF